MVSQRVASRSQVIRRQREPSSKNVKARFVGHSANRMFRLPPWIATCGVRLFVAATVLSVAVFAATIPQRFATLDGDETAQQKAAPLSPASRLGSKSGAGARKASQPSGTKKTSNAPGARKGAASVMQEPSPGRSGSAGTETPQDRTRK